MSSPKDPYTPEELRELLGSLPTPAARPEFRESLRARFRDGSLAEGEDGAAPPASAPASPGRVLRPHWWQRRSFVGLAAAAAIVLLMLPLSQATGLEWDVVGMAGSGRVKIDDRWFSVQDEADARALSRRLREGARVETDGDVEVTVRSDSVVFCIQPGACIELPTQPGWWKGGAGPLKSRLLEGSVHVLTGLPSTQPLHMETDDTVVKLQDCTVGVQCSPDGTCVLVLEGQAKVEGWLGDCEVEEGTRRWPCPEFHHPRVDPLTDEDRAQLGQTRESFAAMLRD